MGFHLHVNLPECCYWVRTSNQGVSQIEASGIFMSIRVYVSPSYPIVPGFMTMTFLL